MNKIIAEYTSLIKELEKKRQQLLKDIYAKSDNVELKKEYLKKYDQLLEGYYDGLSDN